MKQNQNFPPLHQRKNSHQLLEKTFASLREAVFIIDAKTTRILNCNPAASQIFGYRKEEMLGQTTNFLHVDEEKLEEFRESLFPAVEKRGCLDLPEFQMKRKNGEVFFTNHTVMPLEDDQGKRIGWVSVVRDITDRKRSEELLLKNEKRLKRSQEIAHLGSWELDLINNILTWSDEVYRIFGLKPQEFGATYEAFLEAIHPDDRTAVDAAYSGSLWEGRDTYEIEHRVVRKSTGEIRYVHEKCEHVRDETGKVIRSVGMVHDITERKQMEDELRRSHNELEKQVQERTLKLQESEGRLRALASELINAQETERKRIAHELHDSLASQLAAIKYRVEHRYKHAVSAEGATMLKETIQDIQNGIMETRRIMANLRPSILDDLGILPAMRWFSKEIAKAYPGVFVDCSTSIQEQEIPEELKIVVFRVVQEAVTNAIRHGKSNRIRIGLNRNRDWFRLKVMDNGNGFVSAEGKSSTGGIGLDSMRQRVESTAGIFSIRSGPEMGTVVEAKWRIGKECG